VIPLHEDVFQAYCYYQQNSDKQDVNEIAKVIATEVSAIYATASIPVIAFDSIVKKVKRAIEKGKDLQKYPMSKRTSSNYQKTFSSYHDLFDICTCRCYDGGIRERHDCKCPLEFRIPALEWDFWIDQKTVRKMIIGKIDAVVTNKLQKLEERKMSASKYEAHIKQLGEGCSSSLEVQEGPSATSDDESSCKMSEESDDSEGFDGSNLPQNRNQYPELSKAVDRAKVSNRDACLIVNAVLKDLGMLTSENTLYPNKLRRQRQLWRKKLSVLHEEENQGIICLGFDGKIDETLTKVGSVCRKRREEHYVLVSFPSRTYVDHVVPASGSSDDISKEILSVIVQSNSTLTLQAVVCDGTPVNTGVKNGLIRKIELQLQKPLQWLICLMHANELPLRKLIEALYGKSTGPRTNQGPFASMLDFDPQHKPIIFFDPIAGCVADVHDLVKNDLSTDQLYLLRICLLVQRGVYIENSYTDFLQTAQPGAISHSRWLTKANRLLRLYISEEKPSAKLKRLVHFVVNFYAPSWFQIKSHSSCQDGAKNFFFMISLFQRLEKADQDIIGPVLVNNNYFANPENILLAAVADENESIRKLACEKILQSRQSNITTEIPRVFDKKNININFSASSFMDMIDWQAVDITSPPLLKDTSSETIALFQQITLPQFPCHSQDVERNIKDVSAVCGKVFGHDSRHGAILQTKKSRTEIPVIETKANFL
jgi:hypothetical protein